jgi:hypothetical protein
VAAVLLTVGWAIDGVAQVERVELSPAKTSIVAGDSIRLTLVARDRAGASLPVEQPFWGVGPFEVATVSPDGWVRTYRRGSVKVVARVGGKTATAAIEVLPKPAAAITASADAGTIVVGGRTAIRATARDRDQEPLTDAVLAFRSLDAEIAAVSEGGIVEGLRPGTARIEVALRPARSVITVEVIANPVTQIRVTGPTTGRTGDVLRFGAALTSAGGRAVGRLAPVWSVTGAGGSIFPDGAFVAERAGAFVVTATVGSRSASAAVTVTPRAHDRKLETVTTHTYRDLQAAELWAINDALYVSTIADRVYAYDISDPAAPKLVDSVMVDARLINDVSTTADGKVGVITREGASSRKNGIVFLDLADPLRPKVLSEFTETVTSGVHSAFIDGHHAYLTDDGRRSLRIIDFSDPRRPKEVGSWQAENSVLSGGRQATGAIMPAGAAVNGRYLHDLQVVDGLAYLAYFKDGLIILDVGNGIKGGSPSNPKFVSQFVYNTTDFYPPDMLAGAHTVFRFGKYLIVGDEVFPQFYDYLSRDHIRTMGRLHILDVSDIEHPKLVAFYEVPDQGSHNVWVENDVLYVGNFEAGLRAVDVSGELRGDLRAQGREIGAIRTAAANGFRPNVPMAWGAQPHKGMIYASDMNSGLWVARLTRKAVIP